MLISSVRFMQTGGSEYDDRDVTKGLSATTPGDGRVFCTNGVCSFMRRNLKKALWGVLLLPFVLAGVWLHQLYRGIDEDLGYSPPEPLRIVVTDPTCDRSAPGSLESRVRRDYGPLGTFLREKLARPVEILCIGDLREILKSPDRPADLIIGKAIAVSLDAAEANKPVRPIARLTDGQGDVEVWGLFVVRTLSPAKALGDLADHRILFGPVRDVERHADALAALAEHGVAPVPPLQIVEDCAVRSRRSPRATQMSRSYPVMPCHCWRVRSVSTKERCEWSDKRRNSHSSLHSRPPA